MFSIEIYPGFKSSFWIKNKMRERERERTIIAISNICKRWLLVDDESCVNTLYIAIVA